MNSHILEVGITAALDPQVTPHGRTFLRALAAARNHIPDLCRVHFVFSDDAADPGVARAVAKRFVADGLDLVVGHFSSDAALAVLDIYADAGIPLLNPAATANAVTAGPGVYRLCPPDRALAACLLQFAGSRGWRSLRLCSDDSAHGLAIAAAVRSAAAEYGIEIVRSGRSCAAVFAGRFAASAAHVAEHLAASPDLPLVLTDDAVSVHMPGRPALRPPVYAVGFRPADTYPDAQCVCRQHELLFGTQPETYFLESYAAFQVVAALLAAPSTARLGRLLDQSSFATVLGPLRFEGGDACGLGHALWSLGAAGFVPLRGEAGPVAAAAQPSSIGSTYRAAERISS